MPEMLLRVDTEERDDCAVVTAVGEIDAATADQLATAVSDALATPPPQVLLDFSGVTFIDSTGLGVLVKSHRAAEQAGARFAVVHPTPQTRKLIRVLGLDQLLRVYDSQADALADVPTDTPATRRATAALRRPDPGRGLVVLVGRRVLAVRARARRPRQLLGRPYDDQPVAAHQLGDRRVEVAVHRAVAHDRDHLVGQRLRLLAHLGDQQVALGDLEPLAVGQQVLHHRRPASGSASTGPAAGRRRRRR